MFENHFGFIRRPFTAGPDVELFVQNESTRTAFESIEYCIRGGQGMAVLTAPSGVGKTMLCQLLISELRDELTISYLPSPGSSSKLGLLQAIYFGLGKRVKRRHGGITSSEMRLELIDAVRNIRVRSRGVVVLIDEAHLLVEEQLEEVRVLASFADRGQPLFRPVLSGDPELEERLLQPDLKALSQKIRCQTYLESLTRDDSEHFIRHQIVRAGAGNREVFEADAITQIVAAADGVPRCLNQLCDQSLFLAAQKSERIVSRATVDEALDTLVKLPLSWSRPLSSDSPQAVKDYAAPAPAPTPSGGSVVEFGALDDDDASQLEETASEGSVVEVGSTPAADETVSDESLDFIEIDSLPDGEIVAAHEQILAGDHDEVSVHAESVEDELARGEQLEATFRQGLPEAPVPYSEEPVADQYGVSSTEEQPSAPVISSPQAVEDFVSLRPRFDAPSGFDDLLPGSHTRDRANSASPSLVNSGQEGSARIAAAASVRGDQRSTPIFRSEGLATEATQEEELLQSCVETRRDIASMLDTLESQVSESLADRYDIVMPAPDPASDVGLRDLRPASPNREEGEDAKQRLRIEQERGLG